MMEQRVNGVIEFYLSLNKQSNNSKGSSSSAKDCDKERQMTCIRKVHDPVRLEAYSTKKMQDLMHKFSRILYKITQHKWAWPFMQPVDVEGLGLHDYYEVIENPMDFSTIRNRMEATDGTGYKNVQEICADVRLVFKNAMTYNDEDSDVYVMAKTLSAKFEDKWHQLLPKVIKEETRQKEAEAEIHADTLLTQGFSRATAAGNVHAELYELGLQLEDLREAVIKQCRKMTAEEKRRLGMGLSLLSPEDLAKALEIIAQRNPHFQASAEEVDVDMDAQSESTLWRLKLFVKNALGTQARSTAIKAQECSKTKHETCDALARTARKRSRKSP